MLKVGLIFTVTFTLILAVGGTVQTGAEETSSADIVTVRPDVAESSKQGLPIFPGISGKTAGAKGISMLRVVIPP